jgi:hypothetical protein
MAHFGSPTSWSVTNGLANGGDSVFFDDPYRKMQLMMAMSGAAGGMQVPRAAGWSATFGGAAWAGANDAVFCTDADGSAATASG